MLSLCIGPALPALIEDFSVYGTSFELAIIRWRVPRITYVPELYRIIYGEVTESPAILLASEIVAGTTNLTSIDDEYSVVVRNLGPNTRYRYSISASNVLGSRPTVFFNFLTAPNGMCNFKCMNPSPLRKKGFGQDKNGNGQLFNYKPHFKPTA